MTRPCTIEFYAHGLRGLQPFRMLPVNKPHISLNLGLEFQKRVVNSVASNHPTGASPNFCQQIVITADLPVDKLFWPRLGVKVYDSMLGGLSTPLIAHGMLELPEVLEDVKPAVYTHVEELWEFQHARPQVHGEGKWAYVDWAHAEANFANRAGDTKLDFRSFNRAFHDKYSEPAAGRAWEWMTKAPLEDPQKGTDRRVVGSIRHSHVEKIKVNSRPFSSGNFDGWWVIGVQADKWAGTGKWAGEKYGPGLITLSPTRPVEPTLQQGQHKDEKDAAVAGPVGAIVGAASAIWAGHVCRAEPAKDEHVLSHAARDATGKIGTFASVLKKGDKTIEALFDRDDRTSALFGWSGFSEHEHLDGFEFGWKLHKKKGPWQYANAADAKKWRKEGQQHFFDSVRRRCWQRTRQKERFGHRRATPDEGTEGDIVTDQPSAVGSAPAKVARAKTAPTEVEVGATVTVKATPMAPSAVDDEDDAGAVGMVKCTATQQRHKDKPPLLMELRGSPTTHETFTSFDTATPTSSVDCGSETLPLVVQTAQRSTDRSVTPGMRDESHAITGGDVVATLSTNKTSMRNFLPKKTPQAGEGMDSLTKKVERRTANSTNLAALSEAEIEAEAQHTLGCSVNEYVDHICTRAAALEQYHVTQGGLMRDHVPASVGGELDHLFESPAFKSALLYRGSQSSNARRNNFRSVGTLKYQIRVIHSEEVELAAEEPLVDIGSLLKPQSFIVRLYALRGLHLNAQQDMGGGCDPYVHMRLGKNTCGARTQHLSLHGRNVSADSVPFYQLLEMEASLPGESQLKVQVWDYDAVGGDDLMGQTVIDLEDYVFNKSWNSTHYLKHGPLTKGQKLWTLGHLNAIEFSDILDEQRFHELHTFMRHHGQDCALQFKERLFELTVQAIALLGLYVDKIEPSPIPRGTQVEVKADGTQASSGSIWLKAKVLETLLGTAHIPKEERRVLVKAGWYYVEVEKAGPKDLVCKVLLDEGEGKVAWVKCTDRLRLTNYRSVDIIYIERHDSTLVLMPKQPNAEEHHVHVLVQDLAKGMNGLGWVKPPVVASTSQAGGGQDEETEKESIQDMDNLGEFLQRQQEAAAAAAAAAGEGDAAPDTAPGAVGYDAMLAESRAAAAAESKNRRKFWHHRRMAVLEALAKRLLLYEDQQTLVLKFDIGNEPTEAGGVDMEREGSEDTPQPRGVPPMLMQLYALCEKSIDTGAPFKPVEERPLYHPSKFSMHQQGSLEMWVDILPVEIARLNPPMELTLPSLYKGELRVIVWGATQLKNLDIEGLNDAYTRVWLAEDEHTAHVTDTHWRSRHGKANWNYRMKFKVDIGARGRQEHRRLHFQVWDRDASSPSDLIGEEAINLDPHMLVREMIEQGGNVRGASSGGSGASSQRTGAGVAGADATLHEEDQTYSYFEHVRIVQRQVDALRAELTNVHTDLVDDAELLTPEGRALMLAKKRLIATRLERDPTLDMNVFPRYGPFQRQLREEARLLFPKKRKPVGHSFAMLERMQRRIHHSVVGSSADAPDRHEEMLEDEEEPLLPDREGAQGPGMNEIICGTFCKGVVWIASLGCNMLLYICFESFVADLKTFICGYMPASVRNRQRLPRFYLPLRAARNDNRVGEEHGAYTGVLEISLEWLPEAQTKVKLNGIGREEPNAHPFLPKPWGRLQFTWTNPFASVYQLLGPDLCKLMIVGLVTYWLFAVVLPILISQLILQLFFF
jgi:hypothetical protein